MAARHMERWKCGRVSEGAFNPLFIRHADIRATVAPFLVVHYRILTRSIPASSVVIIYGKSTRISSLLSSLQLFPVSYSFWDSFGLKRYIGYSPYSF